MFELPPYPNLLIVPFNVWYTIMYEDEDASSSSFDALLGPTAVVRKGVFAEGYLSNFAFRYVRFCDDCYVYLAVIQVTFN